MSPSSSRVAAITAPSQPLPLVRHLSYRASRVLVRTPLTPNQITWTALALGLAASVALLRGDRGGDLAAAVLLVLCYVLDNCDGEIARAKSLSSTFGAQLDTAVDAVVHAVFFIALGHAEWRTTGHVTWAVLGWAAAGGATVNYVIGLVHDARARRAPATAVPPPVPDPAPRGWRELAVFALRELSRADFCFIVVVLAALDLLHLLLPAAALGAQAYWLSGLWSRARDFHV